MMVINMKFFVKNNQIWSKYAKGEIMVSGNNVRDKYGPFSKKDQISTVIKTTTKVCTMGCGYYLLEIFNS